MEISLDFDAYNKYLKNFKADYNPFTTFGFKICGTDAFFTKIKNNIVLGVTINHDNNSTKIYFDRNNFVIAFDICVKLKFDLYIPEHDCIKIKYCGVTIECDSMVSCFESLNNLRLQNVFFDCVIYIDYVGAEANSIYTYHNLTLFYHVDAYNDEFYHCNIEYERILNDGITETK